MANDPIDLFVGNKVREFRKAKNMSQAHLAESLGVTFQQVQKYERGSNRISVSTLFRMKSALEIPSFDDFYAGMPSK